MVSEVFASYRPEKQKKHSAPVSGQIRKRDGLTNLDRPLRGLVATGRIRHGSWRIKSVTEGDVMASIPQQATHLDDEGAVCEIIDAANLVFQRSTVT